MDMEKTPNGITIKTHPGTLTDAELGDIADLARVIEKQSARYSQLLRDWSEQEVRRRQDDDRPLEPQLCQVEAVEWSNEELAAAAIAAIVAVMASDESSPRVRKFVGRVSLTITSWAAARLAPNH